MEKTKQKKIFDALIVVVAIALCILTVLLEMLDVNYCEEARYNRYIKSFVPLFVGGAAGILFSLKLGIKLFGKPEKLLFLLPCLLVAINNFQFCSFFAEKMSFREDLLAGEWALFAVYCLATGIFEEIIFRGILFPLIAERMEDSKKGLFLAVLFSSLVFGLAHLLNVFMGADLGATLLQVGYSTLTGGMFTFAFIKTKNVLFPVLLHAVYNFGGLLFTSQQGLGTGAVLDLPTGIMMAIVAVVVGVFVVYKTLTYAEEERASLYQKLGIKQSDD